MWTSHDRGRRSQVCNEANNDLYGLCAASHGGVVGCRNQKKGLHTFFIRPAPVGVTREEDSAQEEKDRVHRRVNQKRLMHESPQERRTLEPRLESLPGSPWGRTKRLVWKGGRRPCLEEKPRGELTLAGITLCFWRA